MNRRPSRPQLPRHAFLAALLCAAACGRIDLDASDSLTPGDEGLGGQGSGGDLVGDGDRGGGDGDGDLNPGDGGTGGVVSGDGGSRQTGGRPGTGGEANGSGGESSGGASTGGTSLGGVPSMGGAVLEVLRPRAELTGVAEHIRVREGQDPICANPIVSAASTSRVTLHARHLPAKWTAWGSLNVTSLPVRSARW